MSRFEIKLLDVMVVEGQGLAEGDFELQVKAILHPGDKAISWPDIADDPKAYRKVPLIEPLAVERLYLNNYFSIAKAKRDLGYEPLFNTEQAMKECMPYYVELFRQMEAADAK